MLNGVGVAGTMESSDIMITIEKNEGKGIEIQLKSIVENQFGQHIRKIIKEMLEEQGITDVLVRVNDKGALDCTIKARVTTAVNRASGEKIQPWEVK